MYANCLCVWKEPLHAPTALLHGPTALLCLLKYQLHEASLAIRLQDHPPCHSYDPALPDFLHGIQFYQKISWLSASCLHLIPLPHAVGEPVPMHPVSAVLRHSASFLKMPQTPWLLYQSWWTKPGLSPESLTLKWDRDSSKQENLKVFMGTHSLLSLWMDFKSSCTKYKCHFPSFCMTLSQSFPLCEGGISGSWPQHHS